MLNSKELLMNDEKQKRRSGWYWWALLLPVIYVLSIGPVTKIYVEMEQAHLNTEWIKPCFYRFYAPLHWANRNSTWVDQFFDWYIDDLWQVYP